MAECIWLSTINIGVCVCLCAGVTWVRTRLQFMWYFISELWVLVQYNLLMIFLSVNVLAFLLHVFKLMSLILVTVKLHCEGWLKFFDSTWPPPSSTSCCPHLYLYPTSSPVLVPYIITCTCTLHHHPDHALCGEFERLPDAHCFHSLEHKTNRRGISFVPTALRLLCRAWSALCASWASMYTVSRLYCLNVWWVSD